MLKKGYISSLLLLLLALFSFYCNAPRDNPLDPYGPNSDLVEIKPNLVQITGTVQTISAPLTGIPRVSVFWLPGNMVVTTNDSGKFTISNIEPVDGDLIFKKDGYTPDTAAVKWNNNKQITLPIVNLNKKPTLDGYLIYSEVSNQSAQSNFAAGQMADLVFKVKINDSDNDIDSVYVVYRNIDSTFVGGLELQSKSYQATFSISQLTALSVVETSLDEIVGYNFEVWVIDTFNRRFLVGSNKVARVIKSGVDIVGPNNDSLYMPINLSWNKYQNGFPFTYKVEIFNATNPQPIYARDNIPSDSTSLQINTTSIVTGDYFWAVSVVDKFLDSYKSIPGRFHIN
jgi:hypothetical protein